MENNNLQDQGDAFLFNTPDHGDISLPPGSGWTFAEAGNPLTEIG